jgi:hypothetical protein
MTKTRSRGVIKLTSGVRYPFTSPCPVWLTRLLFKLTFIKPGGWDEYGTRHYFARDEIASVIVTHENQRRR